jgi:hypothetical protein
MSPEKELLIVYIEKGNHGRLRQSISVYGNIGSTLMRNTPAFKRKALP